MTIKTAKQWVDASGRPLTEEEIRAVQQEVVEELDSELVDTGFEGFIKRFVKNSIH